MRQFLADSWPVVLVAGSGLIAWGDLRARVKHVQHDVDTKASKEVLDQINGRLGRIEGALDRLMEREP